MPVAFPALRKGRLFEVHSKRVQSVLVGSHSGRNTRQLIARNPKQTNPKQNGGIALGSDASGQAWETHVVYLMPVHLEVLWKVVLYLIDRLVNRQAEDHPGRKAQQRSGTK